MAKRPKDKTEDAKAKADRMTEESIEDQLAKSRRMVEVVFEDEVVEVYGKDKGKSAYKEGVYRDDFERMLEDLDSGHIEGIAAWKLDRLLRSQRDSVRLLRICKEKKRRIATVVEGVLDPTTGHGKFVFSIMVGVGEMESDNIALRVAAQRERAALDGQPTYGGGRPFAFEDDRITVIPEEADALRDAVRRLLGGESLRKVAQDLNRQGILPTSGRPWSGQTLRRTLSRARYAGLREYKGEILSEARWPAIVPRGEWEQLQELFAKPGRRTGKGRPRTFLLVGGLARCGACGRPLISSRRGGKGSARRYICAPTTGPRPGCGKVGIAADPLDQAIQEAVFRRMRGDQLAAALSVSEDAEVAAWGARLDQLDRTIDQLAADLGAGRIERREWLAARDAAAAERARVQARVARRIQAGALASWPTGEAAVRAEWERASLERRRALLDALLEYVEINPATEKKYAAGKGGRVFDASPPRVVLRWRG